MSGNSARIPDGESKGQLGKCRFFGVENKLADNRLPLITSLCEEQAAEAAVSGSSARKAPQGEAKEWLTILCRQGEACIKGNE